MLGRRRLLILIAMSLSVAPAGCGSGPRPTKATESNGSQFQAVRDDALTVYAYVPYPGYWNGTSPNDLTGGLEYEIARELQKSLSLPALKVKNVNYTALTGGVLADQYDLGMANIFATPERKKVNDYSICYADAHAVAVVKKETPLASVADAKKLRWGLEVGTSTGAIITRGVRPETEPRQFQNTAAMMPLLLTGQIDAVFNGIASVAPYMSKPEYKDYRIATQINFEDAEKAGLCAAVQLPKGSPNKAVVDRELKRMIDSGLIAEWTAKYLTPQFSGYDPNKIPVLTVNAE